MNLRNKYLLNTIRIIFGLFMVFSGVSGLLMGDTTEGLPEALIGVNHSLWQSGIFQMIKVTELVVGIMLLLNFLPALAAIFIAPVAVGVIVFNAMLSPAFLPVGILFALLTAYFGYAYWDKYKALFEK